ncbi:hypothetical protein AX774_g2 [Zancudomyces culisetae]|uniref:Ribosome biogenesis protein SLX9 n=1 Tax=Zancudomyces culisetae TaxID=1213189 RepID=A0A1R1PZP2_ZANCU|nr:hypothetical protein AX774_g2 [Zancudomyces culisetae]|eukprot:OMH86414.1 hypothetical protein AX774_g2 [Zancudomyces culisetae]
MPKVKRERRKYHLKNPQISRPEQSAKKESEQFDISGLNQSLERTSGGKSNQTVVGTSKWKNVASIVDTLNNKRDIVSAPVLLSTGEQRSSNEIENPSHHFMNIESKKSKMNTRRNNWLEKISASHAVMQREKEKQARKKEKSALLRGLEDILNPDNLERNPKRKNAKNKKSKVNKEPQQPQSNTDVTMKQEQITKSKTKPKKAKVDRNVVSELKRFDLVLADKTFQENPLATLRQHISNTFNQ